MHVYFTCYTPIFYILYYTYYARIFYILYTCIKHNMHVYFTCYCVHIIIIIVGTTGDSSGFKNVPSGTKGLSAGFLKILALHPQYSQSKFTCKAVLISELNEHSAELKHVINTGDIIQLTPEISY